MHENTAGKISNVVKYCIWYTMNDRLTAFGAVTLNVFGVNVLNVKKNNNNKKTTYCCWGTESNKASCKGISKRLNDPQKEV